MGRAIIRVRYTTEARSDLREIARKSHTYWGAEKRLQYLNEIDKKLKFLMQFPRGAIDRPEIARACKAAPVGSHFLLYRFKNGTLEVLRVLHQSMDIDRELTRSLERDRADEHER